MRLPSCLVVGLVLIAWSNVLKADDFAPRQDKLPVPPPEKAIVLFDGSTNLFLSKSGGKPDWRVEDGALVSTRGQSRSNHIVSQWHFRDADIHVEFMLPEKGVGNSGIYIHGNYEMQIYNSGDKAKVNQGDIGALYGFHPPLVNAGRPPGQWQVYDIRYRAPRRDESGKIAQEGTITAWLNGKKVQDEAKFGEPRSKYHPYRYNTTPYLKAIWEHQKRTMTGPVFLQDHDAPVRFRNVWIVPLDDKAFRYEGEQAASDEAVSPLAEFTGTWAFQLPDGNPAWLEVREQDGKPAGSLLWSVGSARPIEQPKLDGDTLTFVRKLRWKPYGNDEVKVIEKPFSARLKGKQLELTVTQTTAGQDQSETLKLTGKHIPPLPPRPNLNKVKFGPPIELFNGKDLTGWRLTNPNKKNGWHVEDGVLVNETPKTDFGAYGDYGNLRTDREFEDFQLTIEYNVAAGGNSGVYLRGMYEAQVVDCDSKMQGISGPGAIFGRITPAKNAGKSGGEWNRYELTLVDRHITVVLNGQKVIDNQPLVGCTGGGISADDTSPGPIFLQGDHTSVRYRNIVLRPRR